MTSKETIKQILKDENFIKQLENLLDKKLNSKRVYDFVGGKNYPFEDFKILKLIHSSTEELIEPIIIDRFDNYILIEKNNKHCVIKAYYKDFKDLEYMNLFICEYIGKEDF